MKCLLRYSYFILLFIIIASSCKKDKVTPPIVTTTSIKEITWTTATSGGDVTNNGGATVIERGVCWNVSTNPTISNSRTIEGGNTGSYSSSLTSLSPNTKYYVRAYATNSAGTGYGNEVTFTTSQVILPAVSTNAITDITTTTAVSGGSISSDGGSSVSARGVCYGTSTNPVVTGSHTTDGSGVGSFTSSLANLNPNTTYYVRAYAVNSAGTVYGNEISFKTNQVIVPTIITTSATNITSTSLTTGGNITSDGGANVTSRGVCWATTTNPTISNSKTSDGTGTGSFSSNITGLNPGVTYHIRAFATNSAGTGYGNEITITAIATLPVLTTVAISGITTTTASSGGNITDDGGSAVISRGVCWSTVTGPTVSGTHTSDGTGEGSFTSNITGLSANVTYYVRAYATNNIGTAYGNEFTFKTSQVTVPTLTTTQASSVTSTTAVSGGNITNEGGGTILERGICWATSENPTVINSKTSEYTGTNPFTCSISGLTPGTTYHVRAYAANVAGVAYGNDITFTTLAGLPSLTTVAVSEINQTSAISGGNIISDGRSPITARGICWGTTLNPTIGEDFTVDGTGTGSYTSSMKCLSHSTTYYVRAYATNSVGTAYGNQQSFTTVPIANPIIFNPNVTYGTVTDVDGNCYRTIQIGTETWIAENLKTTTYNDGSPIPLVTENTAWSNLRSPGYCWFGNDETTNKNVYGALYNCYTVATGKLCPTGWHVSTNFGNIGVNAIEVGYSHWEVYPGHEDLIATNQSGLTILPSSTRNGVSGEFNTPSHSSAFYWMDSQPIITEDSRMAAGKFVTNYNFTWDATWFPPENGFSVRCQKDN